MTRCETCGNEYDKTFRITVDGRDHNFDCFECAIQALAPICTHCGCKIIGHGLESRGYFYCCANCARANQVIDVNDRPVEELVAA